MRPHIPEIPEPFGVSRSLPIARFSPNKSEPFVWGVNESADLILTNTLVPVLELTEWPVQGLRPRLLA